MSPIHGKTGRVVAWLLKDEVLDSEGKPRAYLDDDTVYTFGGTYVGVLENGFFRDRAGDAVAYLTGATGGPLLPTSEMRPTPPMPQVAPGRATTPPPPIPPIGSLRWSMLPWPIYLTGQVRTS